MTSSPYDPRTEDEHPVELEDVPEQEDISEADAARRIDEDPEEQVNRPDQERDRARARSDEDS